jgi:hypothetical protein
MSEVRYEAHPALFRMRPVAAGLAVLLGVIGVLLVGAGERIAPGVLAPLGIGISGQNLQYVGVFVAFIACVQLFAWYAPTQCQRFTVTDDRVRLATGFSQKFYTEVGLDAVHALQIDQTPLQRVTGAGDVTVYTRVDQPAIRVRGLPDVDRVRALVTPRGAA